MTERAAKIRLYVDAPLAAGDALTLTDQAHYLAGVMRTAAGDRIALFNGRDGEWAAEITQVRRKAVEVRVLDRTAPQQDPPDLWLLFAPIKKARTDFIVEKATELGCARVQPVLTRFTNAERVRVDRLQTHAIEAAEQCGGTYVPEVAEPLRLPDALAALGDRRLMFCDEAGADRSTVRSRTALPVARALADQPGGRWAILIGPEGGFSPDEAETLRARALTIPVTLGPRILRADTAAAAAIAAWQIALGDWGSA